MRDIIITVLAIWFIVSVCLFITPRSVECTVMEKYEGHTFTMVVKVKNKLHSRKCDAITYYKYNKGDTAVLPLEGYQSIPVIANFLLSFICFVGYLILEIE